MTNIAKTVDTYIKSNIADLVMFNDLFPNADTEGVISVHDPSARKVLDFIDGSAEYQLNISFTARYEDAKKARETLNAILDLLDNKKLNDELDGFTIKTRVNANVQFIGTDDKNNSLYTCSISCEYKTI